ncbi:MAG TPA: DNA lyase [Bacteroidota bacterium]|nr:DNA lyase [Bacteroidota bacterium]
MSRKRPPALTQDELKRIYRRRRAAIRRRLADFSRVPREEYFYELVYCLLTPQSAAVNAQTVVERLRDSGFRSRDIDPEPFLRNPDAYIRFHRTKAGHLIRMKPLFPGIFAEITSPTPDAQLREWLVRNVPGIGWKEASHFLRNIGRRNLAILDRHILKNLVRLGAIRSLPPTLTPRRYKLLEKKFHTFALQIGIPLDELDLLFWSMETGEILK